MTEKHIDEAKKECILIFNELKERLKTIPNLGIALIFNFNHPTIKRLSAHSFTWIQIDQDRLFFLLHSCANEIMYAQRSDMEKFE